jgi:hypothetical protein
MNLICARNFSNLKRLYITGNPFAHSGKYDILESEIDLRCHGARVVNEIFLSDPSDTNSALNKRLLQPKRLPKIIFNKLIKVKDDVFVRSPYTDFFGIEIPAPSKLQMPNIESPSRDKLINDNLEEKMYDDNEEGPEMDPEKEEDAEDSDSPDNFFLTGANQQALRRNQDNQVHLPQISQNKAPSKSNLRNEESREEAEEPMDEVLPLDVGQITNYQDFLKTCANMIGGRIEYQEKLTMPQAHRLLGTLCRRKIQAQPMENKSYMRSPKLAAQLIQQSYMRGMHNEEREVSKLKPYMSNNTDHHFRSVAQVINKGIEKESVSKS